MEKPIDPGRRAFLGMDPSAPGALAGKRAECHISSLLIHVRPELQGEVAARIGALPGVEAQPDRAAGKLIATLETASTTEIMERLQAIHEMPGVVAVALVYHQWEADGGPAA
jgi:nitrate reductase NapD